MKIDLHAATATVAFDHLRPGDAFFVESEMGEGTLYLRLDCNIEITDPNKPEIVTLYNTVELESGTPCNLRVTEKVKRAEVKIVLDE